VAAFAPRPVLASNDARTIAHLLFSMPQEKFSTAFKGSPMKRAKLSGLKRNAAVVLANAGDEQDVLARLSSL
jgi:epoxyqueuosine reductase QueG